MTITRRAVIDMVATPIETITTMTRAIINITKRITDRMSSTVRPLPRIDRDIAKSTRLYHRHRLRPALTTQIRVANIDECRHWKLSANNWTI